MTQQHVSEHTQLGNFTETIGYCVESPLEVFRAIYKTHAIVEILGISYPFTRHFREGELIIRRANVHPSLTITRHLAEYDLTKHERQYDKRNYDLAQLLYDKIPKMQETMQGYDREFVARKREAIFHNPLILSLAHIVEGITTADELKEWYKTASKN